MRRSSLEIEVESNLGDFRRLWDRLTDHQLPYATALALTRTAQSAQDVLRRRLGQAFTVRNNWVAKGIQVEPASKRDTLARMSARVGSLDRFMGRQELGGEKRPDKGRAVAVPLDIRRTKRDITRPSKWPRALLKKGGRRKFFVRELASGPSKGKLAVLRREGGDRYPLQVLYLLEPEVDVRPHWHLRQTVEQIAPRAFPFHWDAALERAVRTRR